MGNLSPEMRDSSTILPRRRSPSEYSSRRARRKQQEGREESGRKVKGSSRKAEGERKKDEGRE